MKKNIIVYLLAILMCFSLVGCVKIDVSVNDDETQQEEKNPVSTSFGEYTGIYELNNVKIKAIHIGNVVVVSVIKGEDTILGGVYVNLENNNYDEQIQSKFEFAENVINVTSKNDEFAGGEYKKISEYPVEEMYKDQIGDFAYVDSKYNGVYENEKYTIRTYQIKEDTIRFITSNENNGIDIEIEKNEGEDNRFGVNFFGDVYDIKYDGDKLEVKIDSENEDTKCFTGNYTRKAKMSAEEIIINSFELE